MVPCAIAGSMPMFSTMSISPHLGQPTMAMSSPSIQNAGHMPLPCGILMRVFEASVGLRELALGLESSRCVVTRNSICLGNGFLNGFDHECSVLVMCVTCACGVVLELVITPAVASRLLRPFLGINGRTVGRIELVAPRQHPFGLVLLCVAGVD